MVNRTTDKMVKKAGIIDGKQDCRLDGKESRTNRW